MKNNLIFGSISVCLFFFCLLFLFVFSFSFNVCLCIYFFWYFNSFQLSYKCDTHTNTDVIDNKMMALEMLLSLLLFVLFCFFHQFSFFWFTLQINHDSWNHAGSFFSTVIWIHFSGNIDSSAHNLYWYIYSIYLFIIIESYMMLYACVYMKIIIDGATCLIIIYHLFDFFSRW